MVQNKKEKSVIFITNIETLHPHLQVEVEEKIQRRKLHELQQFVLNRKSTEIRKELYEHMVTYGLYYSTKDGEFLEYNKLMDKIKDEFHFSETPPKLHIDEAIQRLNEYDEVVVEEQSLKLTGKKRIQIDSELMTSENIGVKVIKNLKERIKENIPSITTKQLNSITDNLFELFGSLFASYGNETAKIFLKDNKNIQDLNKKTNFQQIYQEKILVILATEHHNTIDKIFHDFFEKSTPEISEFFYTLSQSYVYLQILNVDPELKQLENIAWSKKWIFLDTNVLIFLLFEGNSLFSPMRSLIMQTKKLGPRLLITSKTVQELEQNIENNKEKYRNLKIKSKFVSAFDNVGEENSFLTTYVNAIKEDSDVTIDSFALKYENFTKILEHEFGVQIESDYIESLEEDPNAEKLRSHIITRAIWKVSAVVTHDVYNVLRVHKLRKKGTSDEIGPKSWLLTTDKTLLSAELDTFGENIIPACISTDLWLQLISPFISPTVALKDTSAVFTKLLSSAFKSHKTKPEDISTLLQVFVNDDRFSLEDFKMMIGDKFIQEHLYKVKQKIEKGEDIESEDYKPILDRRIVLKDEKHEKELEKITKEHSKKIEGLKNDLNILSGEVATLKGKDVGRTKQNTFLKKIIIILFSSAIFDAFIGIWIYFKLNYTIDDLIWILVGIFVAESALIFIFHIFTEKRLKNISKIKTWPRSDKFALITLIVVIIGVVVSRIKF